MVYYVKKIILIIAFILICTIGKAQYVYSPSYDSNVDYCMTIKSIITNSDGTDVIFRMYTTSTGVSWWIDSHTYISAYDTGGNKLGVFLVKKIFNSCGSELSFNQEYSLKAYKSDYCDMILRFEKLPYNTRTINIKEVKGGAYWNNIILASNSSSSSSSSQSSSYSSSSSSDGIVGLAVAGAALYGLYKLFTSGDDDSSSSSSSYSSSSFKYSVGDKVYIDIPYKTSSGEGLAGLMFRNTYTLRVMFEIQERGYDKNKEKAYRMYCYGAEFGYSGNWVSSNEIKGKNSAERDAMNAVQPYLYKEATHVESKITGKK